MPDGKSPESTPANTVKSATKPLAAAVRDQLRDILTIDLIDLSVLEAIIGIAHNGRALVSVRDPMGRFDARQRGLSSAAPEPSFAGPPGAAVPPAIPIGPEEPYSPSSLGDWVDGPMARRYAERVEKERRKALADSPVVAALRIEIDELLDVDPFGVEQLNQIQQLAEQGLRVLRSALGIPAPDSSLRARRMNTSYGTYNPNGPWAPSSSQETFGAAMVRESVAAAQNPSGNGPASVTDLATALAAAREAGEEELVAGIEGQLRSRGILSANSDNKEPS